jgi:hypothetical protein
MRQLAVVGETEADEMANTQFGDARTELGRQHGGKTETHLEAYQSIVDREDRRATGKKTRRDTDGDH